MTYYWKNVSIFLACTLIMGNVLKHLFTLISLPNNFLFWILEGVICTVVFNAILILIFKNRPELEFFKEKISKFLKKRGNLNESFNDK
jgi:uncharacterized membrane protein